METNQIYNMDCAKGLKLCASDFVDLTVTSPPYDELRDYGGYSFEFCDIARELYRVMKVGGIIVWIVADQMFGGSESGTAFRQALYFKEIGFRLHDTMIWNKGSTAFQHANRYIQVFEYMFIFSKGKPRCANLIRDRKNVQGGTRIHGTERQPDGTCKQLSAVQKSKVVKEYGARHNVWRINPEKYNRSKCPAVFPRALARDHILTWSNPGDIVLDPFMGSGTTARECIATGRQFIGFEINKDTYLECMEKLAG